MFVGSSPFCNGSHVWVGWGDLFSLRVTPNLCKNRKNPPICCYADGVDCVDFTGCIQQRRMKDRHEASKNDNDKGLKGNYL